MDPYEKVARLLLEHKNISAFTGAGISAESGIPTFRDPGGLWDQFDPDEFGTTGGLIQAALKKPALIRDFLLQMVDIFDRAKPNPGHYGLKSLEELGLLKTIITQNIDHLHQEAGNQRVIEVHGSLFRGRCLSCGRKQQLNKAELLARARKLLEDEEHFEVGKLAELLPRCPACNGVSRPDVVMFGEQVLQLPEAIAVAEQSDLMLVLGTSGVVYPAAAIPYQASERNAVIIEINPSGNYYDSICECYIDSPAGAAMPKIIDRLKDLL
jgi:NAD-dependent deacetylase